MAKQQLKKLNQPKKYLQGGSNMGSLSMMRQNPYYLGQVNQDAAQENFATTQEELMQTKEDAVQAKKDAEAQKKAEMDQTLQQSVGTLGKSLLADKKAGVLGKLWVPGAASSSGIAAPTLQSSIAANSANAAANTGVSTVTGIGGAPITSSIGASAPGAINIGTTGIGGAPIVTNTATNAGTTVAGNAGSTAAGGLSAAATAGIGIAGNIGGMIIRNRTNDDDAYTFTDKEKRGNTAGRMLSSTSTGFGIGNAIVPGIGGVIGGFTGATVGAIKARKENKAAKEEADRLQREQAAVRGAYQSAYVNSRLTGADTGFGLNSSTNMNNQFTNAYQVAKLGGVKRVPGGKIVPIEGTDAVEFKGKSHENGGVTIDKNTEVEGGETMDQVAMNDNNKQDYIFSKYLKLGGKSFAQRHKEILKGSGSQAEIQRLAAMQEETAGRNPQQVARYGGIHKYVDGGVTEPCQNGYVKDADGNCVPQQPYQQEGTFNKEDPGAPTKWEMDNATVNEETVSGYRHRYYVLPDGSTYDPNDMVRKINAVKAEGAQTEANLFALPGAALSGIRSGLAGAARVGYNMINDKALPSGSSGSAGALPPGNTSAVGNYGGNVFAAKPQTESFNVFGNYPAMIKQAGALSASGGQPQNNSGTYSSPTGNGEGQQYFNNVGQNQGQGQSQDQSQSDPYNTAANAERMGWGSDVQGYVNSEFGFGPNYKAPTAPSKGGVKKGKPAYDREAWRKQGVSQMTDEELTAEGLGPKDSIPEGAQYRKAPGVQPPAAAGTAGQAPADITGTFRDNGDGTFSYGSDKTGWETSTDKNVAKSKFQTKQVNAAGAQTTAGSTGYVAPAGVAGSAPNAQTGPVSTTGQTIVNGNPPSNAPTGTQSNVSSQTVTGTGAPAAGTTGTTTTTGAATTGQNPTVTGQKTPANTSNVQGGYGATTTNDKLVGSKTSGYLPTFENAKTNPLWTKDNYGKWKADVGTSMDDPATAQKVADYLINYKGDYSAVVQKRIKGKTGQDLFNTIEKLATDNKPGIFHEAVRQALDASKTTGGTPPPIVPPPTVPEKPGETPTETVKKKEPCGPGTYLSSDGSCQTVPAFKQGTRINGSLVAGLGQLVPIGAALMNPYKIAPGIVGAPGIKGPLMQRMSMNQDRAAAIQQNVAFKNAVVGQNAGPASLVAMQSANTKTNQQMMQIAKQEQDVNRQLASQEASLAMDASKFNADTDQKRQMFNTEFNQKERQYRREDILGALDAGASRIAGIVKDERSYKANERLARALDETHSYDRFSIYEQLTKQAKQKNSPYNGVSDAELRRMAAGISEQIYGEMGVVAEAPATTTTTTQNARTGGVRQYVSRLGELKGVRATKAKL